MSLHTPGKSHQLGFAYNGNRLIQQGVEAVGEDPYDYGNDPNKPFGDYNLEQQGNIVSQRFRGTKTETPMGT